MSRDERNQEFLKKFLEAKKMEKEVQAILHEILCKNPPQEKKKKADKAGVKKVNIV